MFIALTVGLIVFIGVALVVNRRTQRKVIENQTTQSTQNTCSSTAFQDLYDRLGNIETMLRNQKN